MEGGRGGKGGEGRGGFGMRCFQGGEGAGTLYHTSYAFNFEDKNVF